MKTESPKLAVGQDRLSTLRCKLTRPFCHPSKGPVHILQWPSQFFPVPPTTLRKAALEAVQPGQSCMSRPPGILHIWACFEKAARWNCANPLNISKHSKRCITSSWKRRPTMLKYINISIWSVLLTKGFTQVERLQQNRSSPSWVSSSSVMGCGHFCLRPLSVGCPLGGSSVHKSF